jgi:hypothetical protein
MYNTRTDRKTLNGFVLQGCWKEISCDRRNRAREASRLMRGFMREGKVSIPQDWEFTDYPEEQLKEMIQLHRKKKRG